MGKKGREIVETNRDELVKSLNKALALEWSAAFYYWLSTHVLRGLSGTELVEMFEEQIEDELGHASSLAKRISELGGTPVTSLSEIERTSGEKISLPTSLSDVGAFIKTALSIETKAIETYNDLARNTMHSDPVTFLLVSKILGDEVSEEDKLEGFLEKL